MVFVRPQWEPGSVLCVLHLSVLGEKQGFSEFNNRSLFKVTVTARNAAVKCPFLSNSYSNYILGLGIFNIASDR